MDTPRRTPRYHRFVSSFEKRNTVVRTKPWALWLAAIPVLVPSLVLVPWLVSHGLGATLAFFAAYFIALGGLMAFQARVWTSAREDVRADGNGIVIGTRHIARASLGRAFVKRVEDNVAAHRSRGGTDLAFLARAGRSSEQWLRDLAEVGNKSVGYRVASFPEDVLWRVVENAALSPTERAGAAVLLRPTLDDTGIARLRATAEACAAPRLRVALETAAVPTAKEHVLARALDGVEDESARREASR